MDFKKLMFWKKDDLDLGLSTSNLPTHDPGIESNFGLSSVPSMTGSPQPNYPSFQPMAPQESFPSGPSVQANNQTYTLTKEMEVISSKLDALKAAIDNISQRLVNIERVAYSENQPHNKNNFFNETPPRTY